MKAFVIAFEAHRSAFFNRDLEQAECDGFMLVNDHQLFSEYHRPVCRNYLRLQHG